MHIAGCPAKLRRWPLPRFSSLPALPLWVPFLFTLGKSEFVKRFGALSLASLVCAVGLIAFATTNSVMASQQKPLLRLKWVHGYIEPTPLFEKWNSFSRVKVSGDPNELHRPFA